MSDDKKYLRVASLIVSQGNEGLDLSEMRIKFHIDAAQTESPNNAEIHIYNLSDATTKKIRKEFTEVRLEVGYSGSPLGVIFTGTIRQMKIGKENNKDTVLILLASDGDLVYNAAVVNTIVPGGSTADSEIAQMNAQLPNASLGYVVSLAGINPGSAIIRDKVMFGMYRQVARQISKQHNLSWTVNNGKVVFISNDGYIPGTVVKINSLTGMVGIPEQTDSGIKVRALIDPNIQVGGLIEVNERDITALQINDQIPYGNVPYNQVAGIVYAAALSGDGIYMVLSVDYDGDTRGNEWYMDMTCLAVNRDTMKVVAKQ
jgi:hypothetical protein